MTPQQRATHEAEGFFTLKKSPGAGFCGVNGCRRQSAKHKQGLCHTHSQHRWRMKSPKRSAFTALRDHAVARGLKFSISYDYWCGLADAYAMFDHSAESFDQYPSFDRVDSTKGYCPGNLRIITVSQNAVKSNKERFLPAAVQEILARKRAKAQENVGGLLKELDSYAPF
jgi:cobalamin biosynthesis protein CobT